MSFARAGTVGIETSGTDTTPASAIKKIAEAARVPRRCDVVNARLFAAFGHAGRANDVRGRVVEEARAQVV